MMPIANHENNQRDKVQENTCTRKYATYFTPLWTKQGIRYESK